MKIKTKKNKVVDTFNESKTIMDEDSQVVVTVLEKMGIVKAGDQVYAYKDTKFNNLYPCELVAVYDNAAVVVWTNGVVKHICYV